ncbi:MAG TPA: hypothetical protein VIT67_15380, partial [Povalibacter sp.]
MRYQDLRQRALATLVAALGFVNVAGAGINEFTPLGPEGGTVNKVEFHPTDASIAYMATANGFYRSTDGGLNWQKKTSTWLLDFAVDPDDGNRLFIAPVNDGGLLVSLDAGVTLQRVLTLPLTTHGPSAVETSRDGTTYVVAGDRLFRSIDRGVTWEERAALGTSAIVGTLRVDPLDSNRLYAFAGLDHWRSIDGGTSWQPLIFPATSVSDLIVAPVTPRLLFAATSSGVLVSSNNGNNWTSAGLSDYASMIAVDPGNPQILYAQTAPGGLLRTKNQGGSWTPVHTDASTGDITSVAFHPSEPSTLLLGGMGGVARSTTEGASWAAANGGFLATSISKFVPSADSRRIYFNTYSNGVFALDAGTTAVTPVNLEALAAVRYGGPALESFDLLVQGLSPDRLFVGMNQGFARSSDAGDSWQWVNTPGNGAVSRFASHPSQPEVILAVAGPGVHRSVDGGTLWSEVNGLPAYAEASAIEFAPTSASVVYASIWTLPPPYSEVLPAGFYKSTNGGIDWERADTGLPSGFVGNITIDPRTEQTVYVETDTGIFRTTDGGITWTALAWSFVSSSATPVYGLSIDTLHPDIIYARQQEQFGRSIDSGQTWETIHDLIPGGPRVFTVLADPFREHTVFVGGPSTGAYEVTLATDVEIEAAVPLDPLPYGSAPVTHTYTVRNLGPFHATDLNTVIELPASARDISVATTAGTCHAQGSTITCTQRAMLAGRATQITVRSSYAAAGDATVVARVRSSEPDTQLSNNSIESVVHIREVSDLTMLLTAPTTVTEGDTITYSIVVANAGPNDASGVAASIQLAPGLSAASLTASRGTCSAAASG